MLLACCCVQVQLQDIPSMKDFMAAVTDTKEVRRCCSLWHCIEFQRVLI
jgi:hypothetical protein